MAPSPPTHGTPASQAIDGQPAGDAEPATPVLRADRSAAEDGRRGTMHEQEWWGRLSRIQIDLLRPMSARLFESLDDVLFDRSGATFQQFFDGMRVLRRSRDALIEGWFDRIDERWKGLMPQMPGTFRPRLVSARDSFADGDRPRGGFSLDETATFERNLAVDHTVNRGMFLCSAELPALCHRLTLLRKNQVVQEDDVPASPAMMVQTFADSLDEVSDLPVDVSLIVFKLFDRFVMSAVGVVCQELNRFLARGGVAPRWARASSPPGRSAALRPAPSLRAAATDSRGARKGRSWLETMPLLEPGAYEPALRMHHADSIRCGIPSANQYALRDFPQDAFERTQLAAWVRILLEHRRLARQAVLSTAASGPFSVPGYAGSADSSGDNSGWSFAALEAPMLQTLELETLLEALATLPSPSLPASWMDITEGERLDADQLKRELRKVLSDRIHGGDGEVTPHADGRLAEEHGVTLGEYEDVVDMVAMMFSYIQSDPALPAAVQVLLSRLQLPYLRAVLIDPELFSDLHHPARALIDRLAEVGKACMPDNPQLAETMQKMHALVERIVRATTITRILFEQEWAQFSTWCDSIERRVATREHDQVAALVDVELQALVEQTAAEVARGAAGAKSVAQGAATPVPSPESSAAVPSSRAADSGGERSANAYQILLSVTSRMRERLDGKVMPEGLRHALSLLWVNHEVRIREVHGERSYEASWLDRQFNAIVGLFSVEAGARAQADLEQDWPAIERAWKMVLAEGPAPVEARERWIATFRLWADVRTGRVAPDSSRRWNWLEGLVAARLQPAIAGQAPAQATAAANAVAQAESRIEVPAGSPLAAISASEPAPAPAAKPAPVRMVPARWKVGDWIEFRSGAGASHTTFLAASGRVGRGKVTWISSLTGRTILIKPDGTLWREESRLDLDDLLDRELAFVVPRESMFDRSLQSMFSKLRENVTSTLS
ncbi:MAG: DUF1631 family protein [Proteobacteria bacterium]|uniref:DUF1631 family protein n=1 Tax=Rudaea sp. TaxID=2136325 RepID=UPI00321FAAB2|nr:DUF1631 family protein [Pseudomonadota bacterium]